MVQKTQLIDVRKTYLPGDPNSLMENLISTRQEDGEEETVPVTCFEGYNFIPTSYGYKSFFGTNGKIDISALTSRVQFVLIYQDSTYKNWLVALAEDGIWIGNPNIADAEWVHAITLAFDPNVYKEWTYCVIENILYMYPQGENYVYTIDGTVITPVAPTIPYMTPVIGVND